MTDDEIADLLGRVPIVTEREVNLIELMAEADASVEARMAEADTLLARGLIIAMDAMEARLRRHAVAQTRWAGLLATALALLAGILLGAVVIR